MKKLLIIAAILAPLSSRGMELEARDTTFHRGLVVVGGTRREVDELGVICYSSRHWIGNGITELGGCRLGNYNHKLTIAFDPASELRRIRCVIFRSGHLWSLRLPDSVEVLQQMAFSDIGFRGAYGERLDRPGAPVHVSFGLATKVTELEEHLFRKGCLISAHIPTSVERVGRMCFRECGLLASVTFDGCSRLRVMAKAAFYESGLESVDIPASVEKIGKTCFYGCDRLSSVTFGHGSALASVGTRAFGRSGLKTILIPAKVRILPSDCFSQCLELGSVSFEQNSGLIYIKDRAFPTCGELSSVHLPGKFAVNACSSWWRNRVGLDPSVTVTVDSD